MTKDIIKYNALNKISCPYLAYFLGFLWGDGWLFQHNKWRTRGVGCDQNENDFKHVQFIFEKVIPNWRSFVRTIKGKFYPRIYRTDWDLHDFLLNLGYKEKSCSHGRVLEILEEETKRYFLLGLFDADGNIYAGDGGEEARACIVGPIDQNWEALEELINKNGISTSITRRTDKNGHKYSYIFIKNLAHLMKFYPWMYKDCPEDICFQRKRDTFKKVMEYLDRIIPEQYGSDRYLEEGRRDYAMFPFRNFKVTGPVDKSGEEWIWECVYPNGRVEQYSSAVLSGIKSQETRGFFTNGPKSRTRFNRISYCKRSKKWMTVVSLPNGSRCQKRMDSEEEAAKMTDCAMIYYHGSQASDLNFPEEYENYLKMDLAAICRVKSVSSQYWGVSYCRANKNWRARFHHKGKKISCGHFPSEEEAHEAVQKKLKELAAFREEVK